MERFRIDQNVPAFSRLSQMIPPRLTRPFPYGSLGFMIDGLVQFGSTFSGSISGKPFQSPTSPQFRRSLLGFLQLAICRFNSERAEERRQREGFELPKKSYSIHPLGQIRSTSEGPPASLDTVGAPSWSEPSTTATGEALSLTRNVVLPSALDSLQD